MRFTIDAGTFAKAAALCAAITERRNTVPVLSHTLLIAEGGKLRLIASDLDSTVTIDLPCDIETEGARALPAEELAGLVKKAAKERGTPLVDLQLDPETCKAVLCSGRSRFALATLPREDFPVFGAWDAAETWEAAPADCGDHRAEGVTMGEVAPKKLAKVAKYVGNVRALVERRDGENGADRLRITFGNLPGSAAVTFETKLAEPQFRWKPVRSSFTFAADGDGYAEALSYLRTLRAAHGLPLIDGYEGRLQYIEGRAIGLTVGEGFHDYPETRPAPEGWQPPEDAEIQTSGVLQECTVDGVDYVRMHDNPWSYRYVPEIKGYRYPDGAYSLPMPADQRRAVTAITVHVDGEALARPIGTKNGKIHLTAEDVAEMCGPVDPSTFVDIPALAFHHGRVIATGEAAERFNAMAAAFDRNARKALKNCETTADKFLTAHNLGLAWRDKVAAFMETTPIHPAAPVDNSADPFDGFSEPSDFVDAPDNVVHVDFTPAFPADISAKLAGDAAAQAIAPDPMVTLLAECAPPVHSERTPAAVEARLDRIEAALGLVPAAKRSPAHAAAIRRAWALRRELRRERAERARAWLAFADVQSKRADIVERLSRAETFASGERAELVAEIDAQRELNAGMAARLLEFERERPTLMSEVESLRTDLARTRAERDGIAGNLAALSTRVAADALTLDRLQPTPDRPRIILSSR